MSEPPPARVLADEPLPRRTALVPLLEEEEDPTRLDELDEPDDDEDDAPELDPDDEDPLDDDPDEPLEGGAERTGC